MLLDMNPVAKILYLPKLELGLDIKDWLWANMMKLATGICQARSRSTRRIVRVNWIYFSLTI